jgi:hypothetical protein
MSNWANRSKQEINQVELKPVGGGQGGGERVDQFVIFGAPKTEMQKQYKAGEEIRGVYLGSFSQERTVKGKKMIFHTHKVKTAEGKIFGLDGSGLLNYQVKNYLTAGDEVSITYNGKDDQGRHQFETKK